MKSHLLSLFALLLTACGNGDGNNDTLLTGLSGVVILVIVIWLVTRWLRRR